ncbi:MAG: prepilin-type N-terminal cleavage/methylation domain-containing protein [Opitutaceae bacterium]|nr:prepilin-type N-terminal cleavage/methylation domain-containing protein [Opitutaceae bacterium]
MTISTPPIESRRARSRPACRGFTLVEIMVSATLSVIVLAGILSAFLMIGRTSYAAGNYSEMDAQTRRALEAFGADARKAADVRWHDAQTLTLHVSNAGAGTTPVTYGYDGTASSPTYRAFYRLNGDPSATEPKLVLMRNVAGDFAFARFKLEQPGVADNAAANDLETKQVQVTLRTARAGTTTPITTQSAVSARYILRNKRVSN